MRGPGERVPGVVAGGRIAGGPPHLWDGVVRLTHWSLAAAIVANALLTREGGAAHVAVGWAAAALLLLRLGWGLVGPSEARFSAFPPSPRGALRHLATLIAGRPREFRSHNPAGAMMVYALWALLAVVIGTGLGMTRQSPMAIAAQEAAVAEGDWAAMVAEGGGEKGAAGMTEVLEDVHGTAANLILVLAALHVAGVAAESLALRRNLVRAMLFGSRMTRR